MAAQENMEVDVANVLLNSISVFSLVVFSLFYFSGKSLQPHMFKHVKYLHTTLCMSQALSERAYILTFHIHSCRCPQSVISSR